jgi:hypothetical protein
METPVNWNTPNLFPPTENNIRARDRDKIFGFVYSLIAYRFTVDRHGLSKLAMTRYEEWNARFGSRLLVDHQVDQLLATKVAARSLESGNNGTAN